MATADSPGHDGRLHALWIVHYPIFGGPHNRILRLHELMRSKGVEVTALVPSGPGNAADRLRRGGVPVISMPLGRARATRDLHEHVRLARGFRRDIRRVRGAIRQTRADAVIVGGLINTQGAVAARLEQIGVVWQVLDSRTPTPIAAALMPVVNRLANVVTFAGESLIEMHPGAGRLAVPVMVSTPGVDAETFVASDERRTAIRRRLGVAQDALVVGTVANVNRQKGIEYFVRAAAKIQAAVPNAVFLVVGAVQKPGDGYFEHIEVECRAAGLSSGEIIFAGGQRDVHEWYPAMDVKLMTSVPKSEGTPTSILEAWSCGLPVVGTNVGSVDRMIQDGVNGFLVPARDADAIADRTVRLLRDPELRRRFGLAGRRTVEERYTVQRVAGVHVDAVAQAVARSSRQSAGQSSAPKARRELNGKQNPCGRSERRGAGPVWTLGRAVLGGSPRLLAPVATLRSASAQRLVHRQSVACIEGYPRSANTFATTAFQLANPGGRLAHHIHVGGQIARGVRLGVPTALLLRNPLDAAASLVVWSGGGLGARTAVLYYVLFHRAVRAYASEVSACLFEEVVADPGVVVRRLNERYDRSFREPPDDRALITAEMGRRAAAKGRPMRSLPDAERRARTKAARTEVAASPPFPRAWALYAEITSAAGLKASQR